MDARVFIVVIINAIPPFFRALSLEEWHKGAALHVIWNCYSCGFQKGFGVVEILNHVFFIARTGLCHPRPLDDQRHQKRLFVHPALIEPAMIPDVESLVRGVNYYGIVGDSHIIQCPHQGPDAFIDTSNGTEVILCVSLVFPANKVFTLEVCFLELCITRCVMVTPCGQLCGCHP